NVDAVITISEASRQDLLHYLQLPESKVHVVPLAADPSCKPVAMEEARATASHYGLNGQFLLYVGALEPRKNVPTLLRAFARLRADLPNITLALGGSARWKFAELSRTLRELALGSAVHFTGYIADSDLPALYSAASALCFPSLYEGFGLPVLEAMA